MCGHLSTASQCFWHGTCIPFISVPVGTHMVISDGHVISDPLIRITICTVHIVPEQRLTSGHTMENIMDNITRVSCSTRPSKTDDNQEPAAVVTALTIDWAGMTPEEIRAMAQAGLVIKLQSAMRRAENGIPATMDVNAVEHKIGTRAVKAPVDPIEAAKKMTPEQRAAFIEKLRAM